MDSFWAWYDNLNEPKRCLVMLSFTQPILFLMFQNPPLNFIGGIALAALIVSREKYKKRHQDTDHVDMTD